MYVIFLWFDMNVSLCLRKMFSYGGFVYRMYKNKPELM